MPEAGLRKTYIKKNFAEALQFVNRVGAVAEGMNHHPDILMHDYKKVTLTLSTHEAKTADGQKASGVTRLDFELAEKVDQILMHNP